ncbi:LOW QUALITY PROTEIN: leucine-rich repeat-containing protein 47-like [Chelonus insularis]|uniref:LOW QUALITY PROTEIN: leucine-rich repeat-containing protein 47-like n=1 Tax=Chelonus insularis TaxID=460826 RepID=UPI00158A34B2|nr:LOW QUALITY PROTEIN: leucine-rich repeat-containing protein 47-like [Chelonus insularis]
MTDNVNNNDKWSEIEQVKKEKRHELVLSGSTISQRISSSGLDINLFDLNSLNYLNINQTCLQFIPDEIEKLTNLTTLVLHSNKLKKIPTTIKNLVKLKILDCSYNQLETIPDEISALIQITSINLNSNSLKTLPCLKFNTKLSSLNLSNNNFQIFPDICYDSLIHLAEIKISNNPIEELPATINHLPSLKHLDISDNKITVVPGELADCNKLKELNLKGNKLKDKRLSKLVDQCRTKQIIDYIGQHCAKVAKDGKLTEKENEKSGKKGSKNHKSQSKDNDVNNEAHKLKILRADDSIMVIKLLDNVKTVRPFIVCCIVKNLSFDENTFKKFIQLQTKLHETICERRNAATIATHDFDLIPPGELTYTAKSPTEIKMKPLGRKNVFTAAELFKHLQIDADNLRREKKRNVYSGIHKYLYLIEGKPLYPCLLDSSNQVISFPPITNSDITKMSVNTKNMLIEVTSATSQLVCRNVLDAFLKELVIQGLCTSAQNVDEKVEYHTLEIQQVKVVDAEGNLKYVYPSRADLNFNDDKIVVLRD